MQLTQSLFITLLLTTLLLASAAYGDETQTSASADDTAGAKSTKAKLELSVLSGKALFGTGETKLNAAGEAALIKLSDDLRRYESIVSIRVIGHTDNVGDQTSNQILSQQRADAIALQITTHLQNSMPTLRITAMGAGEDYPISTNATASGRSLNRRVEIQVLVTSRTSD